MVPYHWQQLCFVFPVPDPNCTPSSGPFCLKIPSAEEDRYSKEEISYKHKSFEGKIKACEKQSKDKEITTLSTPKKILWGGFILHPLCNLIRIYLLKILVRGKSLIAYLVIIYILLKNIGRLGWKK